MGRVKPPSMADFRSQFKKGPKGPAYMADSRFDFMEQANRAYLKSLRPPIISDDEQDETAAPKKQCARGARGAKKKKRNENTFKTPFTVIPPKKKGKNPNAKESTKVSESKHPDAAADGAVVGVAEGVKVNRRVAKQAEETQKADEPVVTMEAASNKALSESEGPVDSLSPMSGVQGDFEAGMDDLFGEDELMLNEEDMGAHCENANDKDHEGDLATEPSAQDEDQDEDDQDVDEDDSPPPPRRINARNMRTVSDSEESDNDDSDDHPHPRRMRPRRTTTIGDDSDEDEGDNDGDFSNEVDDAEADAEEDGTYLTPTDSWPLHGDLSTEVTAHLGLARVPMADAQEFSDKLRELLDKEYTRQCYTTGAEVGWDFKDVGIDFFGDAKMEMAQKFKNERDGTGFMGKTMHIRYAMPW